MRLLLLTASLTTAKIFPRGIDPVNQHLYNPHPNNKFKCILTGDLIDHAYLNDNYCDCPDGSDEPGTSACAHLSSIPNTHTGFWCRNHNHKSLTISPVLVDDGICDCCDGSDESEIQCENICNQVGAAQRKKDEEANQKAAAGIAVREQWSKDVASDIEKLDVELEKIENLLSQLAEEKVKLEEDQKAAQEAEKVEKTRCEDIKKDLEELEKEKMAQVGIEMAFRLLDLNKNNLLRYDEVQKFPCLNPNLGGEFSDMFAKMLLGDEKEVDFETFQKVTWDMISEHFDIDGSVKEDNLDCLPDEALGVEDEGENEDGGIPDNLSIGGNVGDIPEVEIPEESRDEEKERVEDLMNKVDPDDGIEEISQEDLGDDSHNYEDEDEDFDYDDYDDYDYDAHNDDEEDEEPRRVQPKTPTPSKTVNGVEYDEAAQAAINRASDATKKVTDKNNEIRRLENEVKSLKKKQGIDFGSDHAFYKMYEDCLQFKTTDYVYELCLFGKAAQKPPHGSGGGTSLGTFDSWTKKYEEQVYKKGAKCWNGPERSAIAHFVCGQVAKIVEVSEPQRCEYLFKIETPAVCQKVRHDEL